MPLQPSVKIKYPAGEIFVYACARTWARGFKEISRLINEGVRKEDIHANIPLQSLAIASLSEAAFFNGSYNPHWELFLPDALPRWNKELEEAAWERRNLAPRSEVYNYLKATRKRKVIGE